MGIQRYVFFSIFDCEKNPEVPLLQVKSCTEKFLQASGLNYTTFRLCGFMQVTAPSSECMRNVLQRSRVDWMLIERQKKRAGLEYG